MRNSNKLYRATILLMGCLVIGFAFTSCISAVNAAGFGPSGTGGALTPGQLTGTTTNDNAAAGKVGEFVEATVPGASAIAWTTGSGGLQNLTSISLTAGDWDVEGLLSMVGPAVSNTTVGINTVSVTMPATQYQNTAASPSANGGAVVPRRRISLSSTTTVYLVVSLFGGGTASDSIYGYINARRVR